VSLIRKGSGKTKVLTDPDLLIGLADQTNSPKLALYAATYVAKLYSCRLNLPSKLGQAICVWCGRPTAHLCLFFRVAGKEKKENLKIVKYLLFLFTGYA
jgi:hypothetical protein